MDPEFWHQRWQNREIGFHRNDVNPLLVEHIEKLSLPKGSHIFLPLCGKTLDIAWLLSQGYRVTGVELVELAVKELFEELDVTPDTSNIEDTTLYSADSLDIFVGDFFDITINNLEQVDAIYDRAALVALPENIRPQYTAHLTDITNNAPQLLITFEYDQGVMNGPPFSVHNDEVKQYYSNRYAMSLATSANVPGGLRGTCPAIENVWILQNNQQQI